MSTEIKKDDPKDQPKATFLSTLGKHLVVGSAKLPAIEPNPPVIPDDQAAADKAAADKLAADKVIADAAAADKEVADKAAADKVIADAAAAEAAAKPKPKKSEPLPPVDKDDLAVAPVPPVEPKKVDTLLTFKPTRAEFKYVEVLQAGAEREPEKYQAILDREVDRLNRFNEFTAKWRVDHPEEELTPDDPEVRRYLKANPPAIDATEHQDLKDELLIEKGRTLAREDAASADAATARRVAVIETRPIIAKAEQMVENVMLAAIPGALEKDDLLSEVATEGMAALLKVPGEGRIIGVALKRGQAVVAEYLRLRHRGVRFDPNNEMHVFISRSIATAAEVFEAQGGAERFRGGKRFVDPATLNRMKPEARDKVWTFDDDDMIGTFSTLAAIGAVDELKEKRADAAAAADYRKARKPDGKQTLPPKKEEVVKEVPKSSPALTPVPSTGAGKGTPTPPKVPQMRAFLGI